MKRNEGFTLLEVLVALLVTGICLAVVFQSFSQSMRLRVKADALDEAVQAAQNLLHDEAFVTELLARRGGSGPVPDAAPWQYQARVEPLRWATGPDQEPLLVEGMWELTLCVTKAAHGTGAPRCVTGWYRAIP
uniref:Prepilin-type N-terminal cleavage/methylation domain-containing protein n=1 Tax=Desulfacinum infernum TaxID=35837 RepID=A0A832A2W6_9BACT